MKRNEFTNYLGTFDALVSSLEHPDFIRGAKKAYDQGMDIETLSFYHSVSVESIQRDFEKLDKIVEISKSFSNGVPND